VATTPTEVCNIALGRIGIRQPLTELAEDSAEAEMCSVFYEDARDAVLEVLPWKFATKRASLAALAEASGGERSGWEFVYTLPADCIAPREIYSGTRNPPADQRIPFDVEHNEDTGKSVLLCDMEEAELIYTARIATVAIFTPLFIDCLAFKLAADLAMALPNKAPLSDLMERRYERALALAGASTLRQGQRDAPPRSAFTRVR
jgi:hypothetical protein